MASLVVPRRRAIAAAEVPSVRELVDRVQVEAGEVCPGQVQAVEDRGGRLPFGELVPDLMAGQEVLCHAGELSGELGCQGGDEGGQPVLEFLVVAGP